MIVDPIDSIRETEKTKLVKPEDYFRLKYGTKHLKQKYKLLYSIKNFIVSLTRKNEIIMIVDPIDRIKETEKIILINPEEYWRLKYAKKHLKQKSKLLQIVKKIIVTLTRKNKIIMIVDPLNETEKIKWVNFEDYFRLKYGKKPLKKKSQLLKKIKKLLCL